jgi:hypothetical protein
MESAKREVASAVEFVSLRDELACIKLKCVLQNTPRRMVIEILVLPVNHEGLL